jgi:YfiH family protein
VPLLAVAPHLFTSAAVSVSRDPADPGLAAVAPSLGLTPEAIEQVHQVHGCDVKFVRNEFHFLQPRPSAGEVAQTEIRSERISADALVSDDPNRAVAVRVADCVPILLADRAGRVVAAVHGGWRGTAAGVVRSAVEVVERQFGVAPRDLLAALGPSICARCYEVGPEVREQFRAAGHRQSALDAWFTRGNGGRFYLDVPRSNRDQLEALGVPASQIFDSGLCTMHNGEAFHSYRRQGTHAGRGLAVIRVQVQGLAQDLRPRSRRSWPKP